MFFKVHRTAERKCDAAWETNSLTFTHTDCVAKTNTAAAPAGAAASVLAVLELCVLTLKYQLK